jgi:hypothetical protein
MASERGGASFCLDHISMRPIRSSEIELTRHSHAIERLSPGGGTTHLRLTDIGFRGCCERVTDTPEMRVGSARDISDFGEARRVEHDPPA